jgi:hypothetical protein
LIGYATLIITASVLVLPDILTGTVTGRKIATFAIAGWRITHIKGTPAKFLGCVEAPHEKAAIELAVKKFMIDETLRSIMRSPGPRLDPTRLPLPAIDRSVCTYRTYGIFRRGRTSV